MLPLNVTTVEKNLNAKDLEQKMADNICFIAEKYLLNDNNSIVIDGEQYLSPDFVVHHINFDKLDNCVDNLIVMSLDEHTKLHRSLRNNNKLIKYCNKFNLDFNEMRAKIEHAK